MIKLLTLLFSVAKLKRCRGYICQSILYISVVNGMSAQVYLKNSFAEDISARIYPNIITNAKVISLLSVGVTDRGTVIMTGLVAFPSHATPPKEESGVSPTVRSVGELLGCPF